MDGILNALSSTLSTAETERPGTSKKLEKAAEQFEALMISQMMKSARESSGGGWLSDGDQTGEDSSMSMAEEQFAQSMASNGGMGLAKMVVHTMSHAQVDVPTNGSPAALQDISDSGLAPGR